MNHLTNQHLTLKTIYQHLIPRISNIISICLISVAFLTTLLDIEKYGLREGLMYENTFIYDAYTFNLVIFGIWFAFLLIKYRPLALPIFLISYIIWDGIGISVGIVGQNGIAFPYINWWIALGITLTLATITYKKHILEFKWNSKALILLFITWMPSSQYVLQQIIPLYDHLTYTTVTFILVYLSIKPYKSTNNHS